MSAISRLVPFVGVFAAALLMIFLQQAAPFFDKTVTAVAAIALLCAMPAVDSAIFGRSVHPALGGGLLGISLGFFVRQSLTFPELATGANRIMAFAFFVSIGLLVLRWFRNRQRA